MSDAPLNESLYTAARRCVKRLWLQRHQPEAASVPMAMGRTERDRLRGWVRQNWPLAIAITGNGLEDRRDATLAAVRRRQPLFDGAFQFQGCAAQIEMLWPAANDAWELGAVTEALRVTDSQLARLAFQAYVASGAGLTLRRVWVWHVNGQYVRGSEVNPPALLVRREVTREVAARCHALEENLGEYYAVLRQACAPEIGLGSQCEKPNDCPFKAHCWAQLPTHNIFHLHKIRREQAFIMARSGQVSLDLLPEKMRQTRHRQIQLTAVATGRAQVDRAAVARFLEQLHYPLFCLDFETVAAAIPPFAGMRPYEMFPVQYSLHILRAPDAEPEHHAYLSDGRADPRPEILARLHEQLDSAGSILAYNARFEQAVLRGLGGGNSADQSWCDGLHERFVDVLSPFKAFAFYHPAQKGSVSLKAVLPAVTGRGYEDLPIREGNTASQEYVRVTFGEAPDAERALIRAQLEAYCARDTEGLVWIIKTLRALAGKG